MTAGQTAFPGGLDSEGTLMRAIDPRTTTLAVQAEPGDTALRVISATGFEPNVVLAIRGEYIVCTTAAGDLLSGCSRGMFGTSPGQHPAGSDITTGWAPVLHNAHTAAIVALESEVRGGGGGGGIGRFLLMGG